MKGIIILSLVLLTGCGTYIPTEQLEADALMSGDWSLVEQRETSMARRLLRRGPQCPDEFVRFCLNKGGGNRCECIPSRALRSLFE